MESRIARGMRRADTALQGFRLEARLSAERSLDNGEKGVQTAGRTGGGITGGVGGAGAITSGRYSQSQQHHADQYGYFQGYPFAIINAIANRLAAQPIRVGKILPKGRDPGKDRRVPYCKSTGVPLIPKHLQEITSRVELIHNHKIHRVLENPNPVMVRHHLLYVTFASVEITGLGYWWMYQDEQSGKHQIWPIPSHWMEPIHEEDKLFHHYRLSLPGTGQTINVPTKQIAAFLMPDPADPFGTYPVMQAMAKSVMTDWSFEVAQRMSLENGINPGLAIMVGKPPEFAGVGGDSMVLTAAQRNQIITAVRRQYRGVTRFDEPLILDALIKDVKKITNSPVEMAFKDSGPLVRNRLCQGWGMNPITLGEIEGVNYASSGVADHHVCRNVFTPRTEVNSQTMTRYVGPYFGGQSTTDEGIYGDLVVYQEPVSPSDPEMEMNRDWGDYDRGIISRNDIRRKRGLEPLKQGNCAFVSGSQAGGWVNVGGSEEDIPEPPVTSDSTQDDHGGGNGDGGDSQDDHEDDHEDDQDEDEEEKKPATHKKVGPYLPPAWVWAYVHGRPKRVKLVDSSGHTHGADGKFGSGGGGSSAGSSRVSDGGHSTGKVGDSAEDHDKTAQGFLSKLKKHGKKAIKAAKLVAAIGSRIVIEASMKSMSGNLADDICDTSHDYSKIINAKGTGDWLSEHLGVSGNFAAKVGSMVLSYAYSKMKAALGKTKTSVTGTGKGGWKGNPETLTIGEVSRIITNIQHGIWTKMGMPHDKLPSLREVEKWLIKRHDEKFTDDSDDENDDEKSGTLPDRVRVQILESSRKSAAVVENMSLEAEKTVREELHPVFERLGSDASKKLREMLAHGNTPSPTEVAHTAINRHLWETELEKALRDTLSAAVATGALTEWNLFREHKMTKGVGGKLKKSFPSRFWAAVKAAAHSVINKGIIRTIVDTVVGAVRKAVKGGVEKRLTGSELADHVAGKALVGAGAEKAARTVARNEGASAVNAGQGAVRGELVRHGAVEGTQWVSMRDARVRDSHRRADGQICRPGRAFHVGGFRCEFPGDKTLPPEERENCRCRAITVFK